MKKTLRPERQIILLQNRVRVFAREQSLFRAGSKIILGVSGGADSLCMLHLVARLAQMEGFSIIAAHLHHGMRGLEADEDQEFVAAAAAGLGVPFVAGREDVPELARSRRIGLEEAGRIARRGFLDRVLQETGADAAATAHTRSDHVETVLLHLLRGAGLHGLVGIPAHGFGCRIRPLLCLTREETRHYCTLLNLVWREDPANEDLNFQRNRIRHSILPALRREINPSVDDALANISHVASDALELVEREGLALLLNARTGNEGLYHRSALREAPPAALTETLRLILHRLRAEPVGVVADDIQRLAQSLRTGGKTSLSGGWMGEVSGEFLRIEQVSAAPQDRGRAAKRYVEILEPLPVLIPSEISIPEGILVTSRPEGGDDSVSTERFSKDENKSLRIRTSIGDPLFLRYPQPGDRLRSAWRLGSRKLSDLFNELGIPTWLRHRWPLVVDQTGILWAPGLAIDERALAPHTGEVVELTWEWSSEWKGCVIPTD